MCWFVLKEHFKSSVGAFRFCLLSNYCLVNFVFGCATGFRIEITSYYNDVSVADVSENAVKFGTKVFSDFMISLTSI